MLGSPCGSTLRATGGGCVKVWAVEEENIIWQGISSALFLHWHFTSPALDFWVSWLLEVYPDHRVALHGGQRLFTRRRAAVVGGWVPRPVRKHCRLQAPLL